MTLCFDVGGTAIKYGLVEGARIEGLSEIPTNAKALGGKGVVSRLCGLMDEMHGGYDRVAVSTAGQVDPSSGSIVYANENIPRYTGTPLRALLEEHGGLPVRVENDVNAAALGEAAYGAGAGWRQFICLTFGTGIGGALVADGAIYHGMHGSAGEFGHFPLYPDGLPCACGQRGCYEQYASTTALVRRVGDPALGDGRAVMDHRNEQPVRKAVDAWLDDVAKGIAALVNCLDPGLVVLGGGIMAQTWIAGEIQRRVVPRVMDSLRDIVIKPAELGNTAGLIGAATLFH